MIMMIVMLMIWKLTNKKNCSLECPAGSKVSIQLVRYGREAPSEQVVDDVDDDDDDDVDDNINDDIDNFVKRIVLILLTIFNYLS